MQKNLVICNDHVINRGECEHYVPIDDIVPIGYKYLWAYSSPELLIINVLPTIQGLPVQIKEKPEVVGLKAWVKENMDYYRMAM